MTNDQETKARSSNGARQYDLAERTLKFAQNVRAFISALPRTIVIIEDGKQLVRSSGSVGANYLEADEALSTKDFLLRMKICRKEAKESHYWLKLLGRDLSQEAKVQQQALLQESRELVLIFHTIIRNTQHNHKE